MANKESWSDIAEIYRNLASTLSDIKYKRAVGDKIRQEMQNDNPILDQYTTPKVNAILGNTFSQDVPLSELISGRLDSRQAGIDAAHGVALTDQFKYGNLNPTENLKVAQARAYDAKQESTDVPVMSEEDAIKMGKVPKGTIIKTPKPQDFKTANDIRKEFINRPEVEQFVAVTPKIGSMDALLKSALAGNQENQIALDQGLITMYNKLTDPNSVVRESEYARTPENIPIMNRIQGAIEKLKKGGGGLTNSDRKALVLGAKIIGNEIGKQYQQTRNGYLDLSKKMNFDDRLITATMPDFKAYNTTDDLNDGSGNPNTSPTGVPSTQNPPSKFIVGQQYKMKDGKIATYNGNGVFE